MLIRWLLIQRMDAYEVTSRQPGAACGFYIQSAYLLLLLWHVASCEPWGAHCPGQPVLNLNNLPDLPTTCPRREWIPHPQSLPPLFLPLSPPPPQSLTAEASLSCEEQLRLTIALGQDMETAAFSEAAEKAVNPCTLNESREMEILTFLSTCHLGFHQPYKLPLKQWFSGLAAALTPLW